MDYGLKIAQSGYDVKTCTDKQCVLTSKYPLLKGVLAGSGSVAITADTPATVTIAHNLGYIPMFQILTKGSVYSDWYGVPNFDGLSGEMYYYFFGRADSTNIYLDLYDVDSSKTVYYKYFIYLDKGKL